MQKRFVPVLVALTGTVLAAGCRQSGSPAPAGSSSAASSASRAVTPAHRPPKERPLAGEQAAIVGGEFLAGSVPGDEGRLPGLEPRRFQAELGAFRIDRLPYPNDPTQPALSGVTRERARHLCADRGRRLCTELEWERACRGPDNEEFATGASWDARCTKQPNECASAFDVVALGAALREWTASDVLEEGPNRPRRAAVRGAAAGAAAGEHRCAARRAADPGEQAADLGFRCCAGAPNAKLVPEPKLGDPFRPTELEAKKLEALLARYPETQALAKDVKYFKHPDSAETVVARGTGERQGFDFGVKPLLWNPAAGVEILLVVARSGDNRPFVVAFHALGDGDYRLASSFVMQNEPGPVAFAYSDSLRARLHFSTCWGCPGENGKILFREPERPVIVQP